MDLFKLKKLLDLLKSKENKSPIKTVSHILQSSYYFQLNYLKYIPILLIKLLHLSLKYVENLLELKLMMSGLERNDGGYKNDILQRAVKALIQFFMHFSTSFIYTKKSV